MQQPGKPSVRPLQNPLLGFMEQFDRSKLVDQKSREELEAQARSAVGRGNTPPTEQDKLSMQRSLLHGATSGRLIAGEMEEGSGRIPMMDCTGMVVGHLEVGQLQTTQSEHSGYSTTRGFFTPPSMLSTPTPSREQVLKDMQVLRSRLGMPPQSPEKAANVAKFHAPSPIPPGGLLGPLATFSMEKDGTVTTIASGEQVVMTADFMTEKVNEVTQPLPTPLGACYRGSRDCDVCAGRNQKERLGPDSGKNDKATKPTGDDIEVIPEENPKLIERQVHHEVVAILWPENYANARTPEQYEGAQAKMRVFVNKGYSFHDLIFPISWNMGKHHCAVCHHQDTVLMERYRCFHEDAIYRSALDPNVIPPAVFEVEPDGSTFFIESEIGPFSYTFVVRFKIKYDRDKGVYTAYVYGSVSGAVEDDHLPSDYEWEFGEFFPEEGLGAFERRVTASFIEDNLVVGDVTHDFRQNENATEEDDRCLNKAHGTSSWEWARRNYMKSNQIGHMENAWSIKYDRECIVCKHVVDFDDDVPEL